MCLCPRMVRRLLPIRSRLRIEWRMMDNSKDRFAALLPYVGRQFVSVQAVLTDAAVVTQLYESLLIRAVDSQEDLEKLILDRSELDAALSQAASRSAFTPPIAPRGRWIRGTNRESHCTTSTTSSITSTCSAAPIWARRSA